MRLAVVAAAVVVLIAAGWYWLGWRRSAEHEAPLTAVPLTSYPGSELYPSFSPDGTQVAFQWCTGGFLSFGDCDIYVKQIGVEQRFRLTTGPAEDHSPAWSPDARFIAFLRQLSANKAAIVLISQRGGQERVLGESDVTTLSELWGPYLAWTPDSKWLVFTSADSTTPGPGLFLLSVETLEKRRLTSPPEDGVTDTCPALSPDGRTLAFTRSKGGSNDIYLLRLGANYEPQGVPERLAGGEGKGRSAAAWTPDGSEIVFASGGIWRVAASTSEKPRKLAIASENTSAVAISRQGNRLAYVDVEWRVSIWRVDLLGPDRVPGVPFNLIPSTRPEYSPSYSPDGKRIVFSADRSGHSEIWMCDSDGSNTAQLTSFGGPTVETPRWSPDGKNVVFKVTAGRGGIYVISANGGPPRRLTTGPSGGKWACWSRDSQSIYFVSSEQVWKMPATGGDPVQITRNGGDVPQESPDGKFLYYIKGDPWPEKCSVWRMPVGGGEETRVLERVHVAGHWVVGEQGIYFFGPEDDKGHSDINFYDFATEKTSKILTIEKAVYEHIEISPDGRTILYSQLDEAGSDLMLVENFR